MVHPPGPSKTRKHCLLLIFCFVQFLDAFNFSALFSALPRIQEDLKMSDGGTTWIISAFQLTFASFLLLSGRLSDLYNPKYTFVIATLGIGVLSVITGFLQSKIPFIICRALAGIMGAMTIPSALTLPVKLFPEPYEQSQAIGTFGGSGGIGNVLGLMIGAIFVKCASWRWIFWFLAILSIPIALRSAFLIPRQRSSAEDDHDRVSSPSNKLNRLDLAGILLLTLSVISFIYSLTEGSAGIWQSAKVLVPLVLSGFLMGGFLLWENLVPSHIAAIPPSTWFYRNFAVLFAVALLPYLWFTTMFDISIAIFKTAPVHMAGTVGAIFNGALQLGSAVGIAAVTSIETSVERKHGGFTGYSGRAAAWWFLVGIVSIEVLAVVIFYRTGTSEDKTPQIKGACADEKHIPAQCAGIVDELPVLKSGDWQPPADEKRA